MRKAQGGKRIARPRYLPTMTHRMTAMVLPLALIALGLRLAWVQENEKPLLSKRYNRSMPEAPPPDPIPGRNSAEIIFDETGKNPGSAAHPNAPGRVRMDAPAQHELGRLNLKRSAINSPVKPEPIPPLDPHFHETIRLSDDTRSDDYPAILSNPKNRDEVWMAWSSYSGRRDQIRLSRRSPDSKQWGTWNLVPGVSGDVWRPELSFDSRNRLWVIWSQQELFDANFDIYARWFDHERWGPLERLTSSPEGDFDHTVRQGPDGTIHIAWQGFRNGQSDIFYMAYDGTGWSQQLRLSESQRNDWAPSLDVSSFGEVFVAWDTYDKGNYDVVFRSIRKGNLSPIRPIADSDALEARSSILLDQQDRLWVAYEIGEYGWGKDQGLLVDPDRVSGSSPNNERQVAVRIVGETLQAAMPEVASKFPRRLWKFIEETDRPHLSQPRLAMDDRGRVSLLLRKYEYRGGTAEFWRPYVLTMTPQGWTEPMQFPYSNGRQTMVASATPSAEGGLWIGWPRDNVPSFSIWTNLPEETLIENVYASRFEPDTKAGVLLGGTEEPDFRRRPAGHTDEMGDVARIRSWRARVSGKNLQILRGDTHRHTEFSMDARGVSDGTPLDFYRYMLDAASMDFGFISDHQYAAEREYWWWLEEKLADLFHAPEQYIALFGYERSVAFPNGHRNIVHAVRGVEPIPMFQSLAMTLRAHTGTGNVQPDDTKLVYESIRRSGGISIPHTTATHMGTDWRDNDPEVEPIVEIYQGIRHSSESPGAPLTDDGKVTAWAGESRREAGYVSHAWDKGYRLGVIASSDHVSTHISYAMVWAEERTRTAVLDAMRQRRTYGATDNIILEFWIGGHFMGEEFSADEVPPIRIRAVGTRPFADVSIIRNNRSIYKSKGGETELEITYQDLQPTAGTNFYYARIIQVDGQIAWSSPIWVNVP